MPGKETFFSKYTMWRNEIYLENSSPVRESLQSTCFRNTGLGLQAQFGERDVLS